MAENIDDILEEILGEDDALASSQGTSKTHESERDKRAKIRKSNEASSHTLGTCQC